MADKVVRLNVRAFIHNARQAAVWKIAIRDICKAIEQLDDQITDLVTASKNLKANPKVNPIGRRTAIAMTVIACAALFLSLAAQTDVMVPPL